MDVVECVPPPRMFLSFAPFLSKTRFLGPWLCRQRCNVRSVNHTATRRFPLAALARPHPRPRIGAVATMIAPATPGVVMTPTAAAGARVGVGARARVGGRAEVVVVAVVVARRRCSILQERVAKHVALRQLRPRRLGHRRCCGLT